MFRDWPGVSTVTVDSSELSDIALLIEWVSGSENDMVFFLWYLFLWKWSVHDSQKYVIDSVWIDIAMQFAV